MNTNTPTHEEIAQHAQHLWRDRGCPPGMDTEIWLEAERQLSSKKTTSPFGARASAETAAESEIEYHISPAVPQQEAIQAALQKQAARAPQVPSHTGRKAKPPESGKPVWSKARSS
jgi:hypothetical protein